MNRAERENAELKKELDGERSLRLTCERQLKRISRNIAELDEDDKEHILFGGLTEQ